MRTGDRATYRYPITGKIEEVTLLEPTRMWVGARYNGLAYNVRNDKGHHWTATTDRLREIPDVTATQRTEVRPRGRTHRPRWERVYAHRTRPASDR